MIYPIRLYGDPVLRTKAKVITDFSIPFEVPGFEPVPLWKIVESMFDTMYNARGVGLAAPQIGLPVRLFVAAEYDDEEEEETDVLEPKESKPLRSKVIRELVMINPKVERLSKKKDRSCQEGCLSVPGVFEEGIPRFRELRVTWQGLDGTVYSEDFEDYMARVMQHENDHLEGKLFLDYLPQEVLEDYRKELSNLQRRAKQYLGTLKGH